jgi:pimeloyl-ACP methyl ester carboxylesterase
MLRAAADAAMVGTHKSDVNESPIPVPGEPALYYLPKALSAVYQPVPSGVNVGIWIMSAWIAALSDSSQLLLRIYSAIVIHNWSWKKLFAFCIKTIAIYLTATIVVQDIGWAPSRVSVSDLIETYWLPSKLSRNRALPLGIDGASLGVHSIEHLNAESSKLYKYDALYVNHGFGSSCLSWLPALGPLVARLGSKIGLGHDAVGFGFTDRPIRDFDSFTAVSSAKIGLALLEPHLNETGGNVMLMGHSMGAIATLRMALGLSNATTKHVILVSPTLGYSQAGDHNQWNRLFRSVTDAPAAYLLKRVVGSKGFWRAGLRRAWGNPNLLTETDILRYQWPSIIKGWERGLVLFAYAQAQTDMTDKELLTRVIEQPNTTVDVILSSKDRIVPAQRIHKFLKEFPTVKVVDLDGLGHDPFEEDLPVFLDAVDWLKSRRAQSIKSY